jgi:predicted small lipoprotein YifL
MKSLFMTAAVVTAAIALGGCPGKRPKPVPGPQSAPAQSAPTSSNERDDDSQRAAATRGHGASEISWFQGTLEEAFSPRPCHERPSLFHY